METDLNIRKSHLQDYIDKLQDVVEVLLGVELVDEEWGRQILRAAKSANEIKFYFINELSDVELDIELAERKTE